MYNCIFSGDPGAELWYCGCWFMRHRLIMLAVAVCAHWKQSQDCWLVEYFTWLQQWILTCKPYVANFSRKIKIKIVKQAIKTTLGLKQLPATMWSELCGYFPQVTLCTSLNNCIPHPAPAASYSSPGAMSHPAELGLAFNYPTLCEKILQSHWLTGEQWANTNTQTLKLPTWRSRRCSSTY